MVNYTAIDRSYVILPKISGILSCIGSGLLATHVWKKGLKDVSLPSQMLFCISIVDIITSFFAYCLSSWLAPRGSLPYASGNSATCSFQGFTFVFSLVYFATAYAELAALYWLMVQRGWTQNQMKRKAITYCFFIPPLLVGFFTAIIPIFFEFYNPALFNCFLNEQPIGCNIYPDVACSRGENARFAQIAVFGYVLFGNVVVAIFIGLLICAVYRQEKKADQYLSKGQKKSRKNTINTAWQGVRYTSAYFLTYLTSYIILGYDSVGNDGANLSDAAKYTLEFFFVILTPMMGAFNACVYFYPRYRAKRKQDPEELPLVCLCIVLGFDELGKQLSDRSRSKTGHSGDATSREEQKMEEAQPNEECIEHSNI